MQVLGLSFLKNFLLSKGQQLSITCRITARELETAAFLVFAELRNRLCKRLVAPAVAHRAVGVGSVVKHMGSRLERPGLEAQPGPSSAG